MLSKEIIAMAVKCSDIVTTCTCENFLRLAGVYVWEDKEFKVRTNEGTDVFEGVELASFDEFRELILNEYPSTGLAKVFDILREVYEKYNLMTNIESQKFIGGTQLPDRFRPLLEKRSQQFDDAASELMDIYETTKEYVYNRYFMHAKLFCKHNTNIRRLFLEQPVMWYIDDLNDEAQYIINRNKEYNSSIWKLRGDIQRIEKEYIKDSIDSYKRAIQDYKNAPFIAECYNELADVAREWTALQVDEREGRRKAYEVSKRIDFEIKYLYMLSVKSYPGTTREELKKTTKRLEEIYDSINPHNECITANKQIDYMYVHWVICYIYSELLHVYQRSEYDSDYNLFAGNKCYEHLYKGVEQGEKMIKDLQHSKYYSIFDEKEYIEIVKVKLEKILNQLKFLKTRF